VVTGLFRTVNYTYNILSPEVSTAVILLMNLIFMFALIWKAAESMNVTAVALTQESHDYEMLKERMRKEETKHLKNKLIESKILQQKAILQATIAGQEKEKKQLGMELHDHINQILASTKLYLELAKSSGDPDL